MKQLDLELLIRAAREKIEYHASVGVGLRLRVLVAAQNELAVLKGLCDVIHGILGQEALGEEITSTELETRANIMFRNLFYQKRILIDVEVKSFPDTAGSHLLLPTSGTDYILFDTETCERYEAFLARQ